MQDDSRRMAFATAGNILWFKSNVISKVTAKWLRCKIWVNQPSSHFHMLCIGILVFLYITKPFLSFMDRWKSPCAFLLWGYCVSLDSPLSLTKLLFWHALYRLNLELSVHSQVEKMSFEMGFFFQKRYYWLREYLFYFEWINNIIKIQSCPYLYIYSIQFLRILEILSWVDTREKLSTAFPLWVRTTSDMKLSTACHQDFSLSFLAYLPVDEI